MYLVSRVRTATPGRLPEAIAWAEESLAHVHSHSSLQVAVGLNVFGRPAGTLVWGSMVDSRATWIEESSKMSADPGFVELGRRGAELFVGPAEDTIRQLVHLAGVSIEGGPPKYYQTWTAQIARFQFDEALAWGIAVSDYVNKLTGTGVLFMVDAYGSFGSVAWVAGTETAAALDATNDAMMGDAGWRKMVADAADLFIDGRTMVSLGRNIA